MDVLSGIGLGAGLLGAMSGGRKPELLDSDRIINKWLSRDTTGRLNADDLKFADDVYQSGAEKLGHRRAGRRSMVAASLAAKGLSTSPVSERIQQEDDATDAASLTDLQRNSSAILHSTRMGRERYNQQANLTAMLQDIANQRFNLLRKDAARSGYMNSLLEFAGPVLDFFSSGGPKAMKSGASGLSYGGDLTDSQWDESMAEDGWSWGGN